MVGSTILLDIFDIFVLNSFFDEALLINPHKINRERVVQIFSKIKDLLNTTELAYIWTAKTKSSPFHYLDYFPTNEELQLFTEMINNEVSDMSVI